VLATRSQRVGVARVEVVAFQFVNPKAWIMGLTAASVFAPDVEPRSLAIATIVNCVHRHWAPLGATLKRWSTRELWRRLFGGAIALLMVYSVVAMWL
jgi:threonine/homoserine/homoserine lactone efflux protein